MNNREYLRELQRLTDTLHSTPPQTILNRLNDMLKENTSKTGKQRMSTELRRHLWRLYTAVRRSMNRGIWARDVEPMHMPDVPFMHSIGYWTIPTMKKHDNVPGERTE
ncbi:MAG: hypothetical protein ACYTBJ_06130 [Planctomycetota bacterium]|jgi:hypothetical protein